RLGAHDASDHRAGAARRCFDVDHASTVKGPGWPGQCDSAETCAGTKACCTTATNFTSSTVTCRASAGQCDVAENCTGTSNACPGDSFKSSTATCTGTSQGGLCDNDARDHCTGSANTSVDVFQASTPTCRAVGGA